MREEHTLFEVRLKRFAALALAVDGCVDEARRNSVDADTRRRQVTSDWQGHAHNAALRGRIAGLADLTIERCDRRNVHDGATLAVFEWLGCAHCSRCKADAIEGADEVDRDDLLEGLEVGGRVVAAVFADGALRPADTGRVHQHAKWAHALGHLDRVHNFVSLGDVDTTEGAADFGGERRTAIFLQVGHDHFCALAGEKTSGGGSDTRSSTSDNCANAVEIHSSQG